MKKNNFILKKMALIFSILFAISIITFFLVELTPGDPAENYLRASRISINADTLEATRKVLELDKPIIIRYLHWIKNLFQGNFGVSYIKKLPVTELFLRALIPSFQLGIISFVLLLLVSPTMGVICAIYKNKFFDYMILFFSYIAISVPTFGLGYLLIIFFSVYLKVLPVSGRGEMKNLILPCITLVFPLIPQGILLIRKEITEEMKKPHVENAIMRGVAKKRIVVNHLFRNISIPVITVLSSKIIYLLTGSVLVEEIFAWPGIGRLFVTAVKSGDIPLIQIMLLFFGVLSVIVNESTQIIVKYIDPKLRLRNER